MGKGTRILLTLAAAVAAFGVAAGPAAAVCPSGWAYGYTYYDNGAWRETQDPSIACRHWPAPGYSTSSTYYRLGSSLTSTFKARARTAAATWSAADPLFHFYELSLGADPYDQTLGMNANIQYPGVNVLDQRWDPFQNRPYLHNWYIRLRTSLAPWGMYWYDGASSDGADIQSVITHEFGHAIVLEDVQGSWGDSTRPSMYYQALPNTTYGRTLASGDITGVSQLY